MRKVTTDYLEEKRNVTTREKDEEKGTGTCAGGGVGGVLFGITSR